LYIEGEIYLLYVRQTLALIRQLCFFIVLQQLQQQQSPLPQHYTADPVLAHEVARTSDKSGSPTYSSFTDEGEAFHYLRGRLLDELFKIVASLDDSYNLMPPHQRAPSSLIGS
jgi:hypothetical protein